MRLVVAGWTCIFVDDRCLGEDLRFDLRWLSFTARRRMRRRAVAVPLSLSRVTIFVRLAIYYAKVMIRMLVIIFGHSVIARRVGVTGHRQVFFVHLMGISANADARSIAVKCLMSSGDVSSSGIPPARALRVLTLSHMTPRIDVLSRRCTSISMQ